MAKIAVRLGPARRLCFVDDDGHDPKVGDRVRVELCDSPGESLGAVVAIDASQMLFGRPATTTGRVVSVEP